MTMLSALCRLRYDGISLVQRKKRP